MSPAKEIRRSLEKTENSLTIQARDVLFGLMGSE